MKVILINGSGGSGKDTVVELVSSYLKNKYSIENISTVDEVKRIARSMGWDNQKDEKGRQFLADLKQVWTNYNNGANEEVLKTLYNHNTYEIYSPKEYIIFVHCREPEALAWFKERLKNHKISVCTLIVKRENITEFFNDADQNVEKFDYDITLINHGSLEDLELICEDLSEIIDNWSLEKKWFIA
jgi:CO dehydrogenase nickel-insertion accessory protein CooC1